MYMADSELVAKFFGPRGLTGIYRANLRRSLLWHRNHGLAEYF
jgi:hypothetical protein